MPGLTRRAAEREVSALAIGGSAESLSRILHLVDHLPVAEVAVFGVPDDFYGEEVMAWVKLHAGRTATEDEIREFCRGAIAHYKIPTYVWFVEEFPMTVTGKLQKFRMREIAVEKMKKEQ